MVDPIKRFAVVGDAGTGKEQQFEVAEAMAETFKQRPYASVLALGDNVYPNGEPEYFTQCITRPYHELFQDGVKFYPVLGNHDVRGTDPGGVSQLNFWGVPRYYNQRLGNVEVFALDATVFFPNYDKAYVGKEAWAKQQATQQLIWLDQALAKSDARFKVVYSHYPIYSVTEGKEPPGFVAQWRQLIEPLLVKHGVDVYLAGHNHDYEKSVVNGVHHFVSGAGGRLKHHEKSEDKFPIYPVQKMVSERHFMLFEEKPEGLAYDVIGENGESFDSGVIPEKQRAPKISPSQYQAYFY